MLAISLSIFILNLKQNLSSLDVTAEAIGMGGFSFNNGNIDNLCDSTSDIAAAARAATTTTTTTSPHTETSTDVDFEDRLRQLVITKRYHQIFLYFYMPIGKQVRDDKDDKLSVGFKSDNIGDPKVNLITLYSILVYTINNQINK